ncbi:MAG TPA: hypothetical protein VEI02_09970 [Planctomycetota bacterium]|nr:hypothetical protein [Planctomycetota bacterium]
MTRTRIESLRRAGAVAAGVALLATVAVSQQSKASVALLSAVDYFPLLPGATWRGVTGDGPRTEDVIAVRDVVTGVDGLDGGPCWEVFTIRGETHRYSYLQVRPDGVYRRRNRYLGSLRGVDPDRPAEPVLRDPLHAGASWSFEGEVTYQISGDAEPPPREACRYVEKAVVEALDDPVETPAGKMSCLRLRRTWTGAMKRGATTEWYAPHVGLAKVVVDALDGAPATSWTLVGFKPGRPFSTTHAIEAVKRAVASDPARDSAAVECVAVEQAPLRGLLRTRFVVVHGDGGAALYVVPFPSDAPKTPATRPVSVLVSAPVPEARLFDPSDAAEWTRLLREDGVPLKTGLGGFHPAEEIARCVALAWAAKAHRRAEAVRFVAFDDGATARVVTDASGRSVAEVAFDVALPTAAPRTKRLRASVALADGAVVDVGIEGRDR